MEPDEINDRPGAETSFFALTRPYPRLSCPQTQSQQFDCYQEIVYDDVNRDGSAYELFCFKWKCLGRSRK